MQRALSHTGRSSCTFSFAYFARTFFTTHCSSRTYRISALKGRNNTAKGEALRKDNTSNSPERAKYLREGCSPSLRVARALSLLVRKIVGAIPCGCPDYHNGPDYPLSTRIIKIRGHDQYYDDHNDIGQPRGIAPT